MKTFKKVFFIALIVFITINVFKLLKDNHSIEYKINDYNIKEHFYINNDYYYDLVIKNKNNTYIYTLNEKLNKDKKIIKDIKEYKSNNLVCIIPIYNKDVKYNMYCSLDNEQVSTNYLQQSGNSDFNSIYKKAKKYNIKLNEDSDVKTTYKKLTVYKKNIPNNHIYFIWNYRGIYIISNKDIKYKKFIDHDLYDNVMDCIVDDYYVLFENSSVNGIEKIYYYDIKKDKVDSFKLEPKFKLTKNSYINGVVDNLIYVTDKKQKKEYTIDIKKKTITEVDNEQTKYIVYDNYQKQELSKSDYFMTDKLFNNNLISDKKVTKSQELKKEYNYYYFIENNKLYKALESNKKDKILLSEVPDITDWIIKNREVIILNEDTIYSYTDQYGFRKILSTNELKYNYKNIYDLWKR